MDIYTLLLIIFLAWYGYIKWQQICPKYETCYKVVRNSNGPLGKYRSAIVGGYAQVDYELNQWASAPKTYAKDGYHLFAFDTFVNAKTFAEADEDLSILRCTYKKSSLLPTPLRRLVYEVGDSPNVTDAQLVRSPTWPQGTIHVKKLKPLELVWCYNYE